LAKHYIYLGGAWREVYTDAAPPTALGTLGTKNPPIDADKNIYRDSTASDALVTSTWTQVKAFLKTYFDTLYSAGGGISKGTAFPGTAEEGDFIYRSDLNKLYKCKETY
jgi:hypothetical protein